MSENLDATQVNNERLKVAKAVCFTQRHHPKAPSIHLEDCDESDVQASVVGVVR